MGLCRHLPWETMIIGGKELVEISYFWSYGVVKMTIVENILLECLRGSLFSFATYRAEFVSTQQETIKSR
jgi:hypothetical protein